MCSSNVVFSVCVNFILVFGTSRLVPNKKMFVYHNMVIPRVHVENDYVVRMELLRLRQRIEGLQLVVGDDVWEGMDEWNTSLERTKDIVEFGGCDECLENEYLQWRLIWLTNLKKLLTYRSKKQYGNRQLLSSS